MISYDVLDDKRRLRVARTLLGYGERVQYSVFECILEDDQRQELWRRLEKVIQAEEDSVRYYRIGTPDQARSSVEIQGQGTLTERPVVYVV